MTTEKIDILIADDHSMVRDALARVLEESDLFNIVATAGNKTEINDILKRDADIILLDYSIPHVDPVRLTEEILSNHSLKVLFFSFNKNPNYAVKVLKAGALGYVIKSDDIDELIKALKKVQSGQTYVSSSISSEVIQRLTSPTNKVEEIDQLSPREFEFIKNLAQGHSLSNIALLMGITTSTASTYRARILEKLNLKSTVEIIKFALDHDIK